MHWRIPALLEMSTGGRFSKQEGNLDQTETFFPSNISQFYFSVSQISLHLRMWYLNQDKANKKVVMSL